MDSSRETPGTSNSNEVPPSGGVAGLDGDSSGVILSERRLRTTSAGPLVRYATPKNTPLGGLLYSRNRS